MKTINLTQGQVALVDDEDYDYLMQWRWFAFKPKTSNTVYAVSHTNGPHHLRKTMRMHRIIMKTPIGIPLDHKDRNGLNNQKSNLRECTDSQNQANRVSVGKSKYLGVFFDGLYDQYIRAAIRINGRKKHLGIFKTEEAAARAYDKAAKVQWGEFANLNFKDEPIISC